MGVLTRRQVSQNHTPSGRAADLALVLTKQELLHDLRGEWLDDIKKEGNSEIFHQLLNFIAVTQDASRSPS